MESIFDPYPYINWDKVRKMVRQQYVWLEPVDSDGLFDFMCRRLGYELAEKEEEQILAKRNVQQLADYREAISKALSQYVFSGANEYKSWRDRADKAAELMKISQLSHDSDAYAKYSYFYKYETALSNCWHQSDNALTGAGIEHFAMAMCDSCIDARISSGELHIKLAPFVHWAFNMANFNGNMIEKATLGAFKCTRGSIIINPDEQFACRALDNLAIKCAVPLQEDNLRYYYLQDGKAGESDYAYGGIISRNSCLGKLKCWIGFQNVTEIMKLRQTRNPGFPDCLALVLDLSISIYDLRCLGEKSKITPNTLLAVYKSILSSNKHRNFRLFNPITMVSNRDIVYDCCSFSGEEGYSTRLIPYFVKTNRGTIIFDNSLACRVPIWRACCPKLRSRMVEYDRLNKSYCATSVSANETGDLDRMRALELELRQTHKCIELYDVHLLHSPCGYPDLINNV